MTKRLDERSYEIQSAGTTYRRNRQHLVKTAEPSVQPDISEQPRPDTNVGSDQSAHQQSQAPAVQASPEQEHVQTSPRTHPTGEKGATTSPRRTHSGRIIREPAKLSDYVRIWTVLFARHIETLTAHFMLLPIDCEHYSTKLLLLFFSFSYHLLLAISRLKKKKKKKIGKMLQYCYCVTLSQPRGMPTSQSRFQ